MFNDLMNHLATMDLFEFTGLVTGLLCVWLLIKQSIWTWPIGFIYALVSLVVFIQAKLYSEFGLHIYYAVMNAYGWYYWSRNDPEDDTQHIPIARINQKTIYLLGVIVLILIPLQAELLQRFTDTDMAYADSTISVLSFVGMWMTARKLIENWYVWLLVDVIATVVYVVKGIELYAILYCVYIGMAVAGYLTWRQALYERESGHTREQVVG